MLKNKQIPSDLIDIIYISQIVHTQIMYILEINERMIINFSYGNFPNEIASYIFFWK